MDIPREIEDFAKELFKQNYSLYVVGGYVRDTLIGITPKDMDICGNIPLEVVEKVAKSLGFSCAIIQRELGTLSLKKASVEVEYTRFRTEEYEKGNHSPKSVQWVDDLNQDAKRRDFTVNAIYYDIIKKYIIDPCHGQDDLANKIIRTVVSPDLTLSRDGLRIVRALRFAQELQFEIDKTTEKACMHFIHLLRDISAERITDELRKIFHAYEKFGQKLSPYKIVQRLNKWRIWKQILPTYAINCFDIDGNGFCIFRKNKNNLLRSFYKKVYTTIPQELGYFGFLILLVIGDMGSNITEGRVTYSVMKVLGNDGLKETKTMQQKVKNILLCLLQKNNFETLLSFKQFAIAYHNYSGDEKRMLHLIDDAYYCKVEAEYLSMKAKNIPFTPAGLDISPKQLEEQGYKGKELGQVLNLLWTEVLLENLPNQEEKLLQYLTNRK